MKNVTFTAICFTLTIPLGCSEDQAARELEKVMLVNNITWANQNQPLNQDLVLEKRLFTIRDSVEQAMARDFELLKQAGRDLLRQKGLDPATAFSGGIHDNRLAMVPAAAEFLDKICRQKGQVIESIRFLPGSERHAAPLNHNNNDLSTDFGGLNRSDNHFQSDLYECLTDEGGRIAVAWGAATYVAGATGYSGSVLIGFVAAGGSALTVGGAITLAAAGYYSYRLSLCMAEKAQERTKDCSITISLDQDCQNRIDRGPAPPLPAGATAEEQLNAQSRNQRYAWCRKYLIDLMREKYTGLDLRLGAETLKLVVQTD